MGVVLCMEGDQMPAVSRFDHLGRRREKTIKNQCLGGDYGKTTHSNLPYCHAIGRETSQVRFRFSV
jgi:hypothetical protein